MSEPQGTAFGLKLKRRKILRMQKSVRKRMAIEYYNTFKNDL